MAQSDKKTRTALGIDPFCEQLSSNLPFSCERWRSQAKLPITARLSIVLDIFLQLQLPTLQLQQKRKRLKGQQQPLIVTDLPQRKEQNQMGTRMQNGIINGMIIMAFYATINYVPSRQKSTLYNLLTDWSLKKKNARNKISIQIRCNFSTQKLWNNLRQHSFVSEPSATIRFSF